MFSLPGLLLAGWLAAILFANFPVSAAEAPAADATLVTAEGKVELSRTGTTTWLAAQTNLTLKFGDRVRTGERSRATIQLANRTVLRVNELTTLRLQPPAPGGGRSASLDQESGSTYLFSRERANEVQFRTPLTSGAIRGTEFHLLVGANGRTVVTLLDGDVFLSNPLGDLALASGEEGIVDPGQPPRKTAVINAVNIIQWCLYYPGVLDPDELNWGGAAPTALNDSLNSYRQGDLLAALAAYPASRAPANDAERIYFAALLLSVGQVEAASAQLTMNSPFADALRQLIAAVKSQPANRVTPPGSVTEWMAESYYRQSRADLDGALAAARNAAQRSPRFGFAWARLAELEFSFGRNDPALDALTKALAISPRNAQAVALRGFVLAAQNRIHEAHAEFDRAIALDGALGNAWLGRGLCKIRLGRAEDGRADLQVAATLEPNRAVLRSYLGKAFGNEGDLPRADQELLLAHRLDPNDPTSWLYSALLHQQQNRVNDAVTDLERSQELNDNRRVFRSRMLLDQDRAVRSANLAALYQGAGMTDLSVREATRAVNSDYANYSAHQFLANSYDALRDPRQINLRYESPWLSELLVANLLAPVGAGNLSQYVSQQEYSKLFERDRFGVSSSTDYFSTGEWFQRASQYGVWGNTSYALDVEYHTDPGHRANNDLEQLTWWAKFKQQLSPSDDLFFLVQGYDTTTGDVGQYYNQYGTLTNSAAPSAGLRVTETQTPNAFVGWHHQWAPGSHTLLLAGRLEDTLTLNDPAAQILFARFAGGMATSFRSQPFTNAYRRGLEAYTAELQHIQQLGSHSIVAGVRYQTGTVDVTNQVDRAGNVPPTVASTNVTASLGRVSIYAYDQWRVFEPLLLIAGVTYDYLRYPVNIDTPPVTSGQNDTSRVSPKAGFIWNVTTNTHLRFAYTRSLGGVFYDQSVRLEPTQIGGFNQTFRSLTPESVVGLVPATRFETFNVGLDHVFPTRTYVNVEAELLTSDAERTVGILTNGSFLPVPNRPGSTPQKLDYEERSLLVTVNQLIDRDWSVGARYRVSEADLDARFTAIPTAVALASGANQNVSAVLHDLDLFVIYNQPCGFFARFDSVWTAQSNQGYSPGLPGDDFWQFHVSAGYRFLQRRAEVRVGILNLTDRDYALNPLNLHLEAPRDRTFTASLRFYF